METQFKIVMLSTSEASNIGYSNGKLFFNKPTNARAYKKQHLYLINTKVIIYHNDWFLNKQGKGYGKNPYLNSPIRILGEDHRANCKEGDVKIIASTDTSLGLPKIGEGFIEAYVKDPNLIVRSVTIKDDRPIIVYQPVVCDHCGKPKQGEQGSMCNHCSKYNRNFIIPNISSSVMDEQQSVGRHNRPTNKPQVDFELLNWEKYLLVQESVANLEAIVYGEEDDSYSNELEEANIELNKFEENFELFFELMSKSSSFAHKAHKILSKL